MDVSPTSVNFQESFRESFLSPLHLGILFLALTLPFTSVEVFAANGEPVQWLVLNIGTAIPLVFALWVLKEPVKRIATHSTRRLVAFFALIGFLRGGLVAVCARQFNLTSDLNLTSRLIISVLFMTGFGLVITYLLARIQWFSRIQSSLIFRREELLKSQSTLREKIDAAAESLQLETQKFIAPTIDLLRDELDSLRTTESVDVQEAIDTFHTAVNDIVRPLSHNLIRDGLHPGFQESKTEVTRTSAFSGNTNFLLRWMPIALIPTTVAIAYLSFSATSRFATSGLFFMFAAIFIVVVAPLVIEKFGEHLAAAQRMSLIRSVWFAVFVSLVVAAVVHAFVEINRENFDPELILLSLTMRLLVISLVAFVLRISNYEKYIELQSAVRDMEIVEATLRRSLWIQRRRLSLHLHGTLQSALSATAIALAKPDLTQQDIERLKQNLNDAVVQVNKQEASRHDVQTVLRDLAGLWSDTVDIMWSVPPRVEELLKEDAELNETVCEILREAISNGVRHGVAKEISIELQWQPHALLIKVIDDGVGFAENYRTGLGTEMLNAVCLEWSRERVDNKSLLIAKLAKSDIPLESASRP
jgi:signal transduction histidine kinase